MKAILFLLLGITLFTTANAQPIAVVTSNTTYSTAYVFYNGTWLAPKTLTGTNPKIASSNETLGIMTSSIGYAFSNGKWEKTVPLSGGVAITSSLGVIGILTSQYAYVFHNENWEQHGISGTGQSVISKGGYLLFITNSFSYVFDIKTNRWFQSPSLNGKLIEYTH